tara:strand:- start:1713 stop:1916 length:204 start_codon:yes stop_codon:yes gene_type:complete
MDEEAEIMVTRHLGVSPMSEEFHEWLSQCPVAWWRIEVVKEYKEGGELFPAHVVYGFPVDDGEDDTD